MFQRTHFQRLYQRIFQEPRTFAQVVYGPRQVGKTTLVQQLLKVSPWPSLYASADAIMPDSGIWISQQWELARLEMKRHHSADGLLVLDEVQKVENWSEYVKREWDADTLSGLGLRVIILGSSRLLLQKGLSESLAGRFESTYLGHWSFLEMKQAFDLDADSYVWFGGYPGAVPLISDETRWKNYVATSLIETSISKDVLMLTQVNKPALLKRLFELGCMYSGQILSFTKILGQIQDAGNTTTIAHYLDLLHQAGLLGGLEKFSPQVVRQRGSSPKFQVHNTALISALHPHTRMEVQPDPAKWGRWVESAVGAHLINEALTHGLSVHYWREGNHEVDFILGYQGRFVGLEVKSGFKSAGKGLAVFSEKFSPCKTLVIGTGGLPWQAFLETDVRMLF